jgi:3',5'-cyclic AMP phosphodiesterase CpdA
LRLALLSDLHLGEHEPGAPAALAAELRAAAPAAILVSGDLTRRALASEFRDAWAFLGSLGAPVLAVPGNHDIPRLDVWARFVSPRSAWRRHFPASGAALLELPGLSVIGLDTVRRAQWHLDWSAGGVPRQRLAALDATLGARGSPRCLVLCHHPLRMPQGSARHGVAGAASVLATLERQRVTAVLSGHLHCDAVLSGSPAQIVSASAFSARGAGTGWTLLDVSETGLGVRFSRGGGGLVAWAGG